MRLKGVLQHKIDNLLIGTTDLYPTFLGLMGLHRLIPNEVAGKDYSGVLTDSKSESVSRPVSTPYLSLEGNKKGVRTNQYTFTVSGDGSVTLYNNIKDPYQITNLSFDSLPSKDKQMLSGELGYWLKLSKDPWAREKKYSNVIDYSYSK